MFAHLPEHVILHCDFYVRWRRLRFHERMSEKGEIMTAWCPRYYGYHLGVTELYWWSFELKISYSVTTGNFPRFYCWKYRRLQFPALCCKWRKGDKLPLETELVALENDTTGWTLEPGYFITQLMIFLHRTKTRLFLLTAVCQKTVYKSAYI